MRQSGNSHRRGRLGATAKLLGGLLAIAANVAAVLPAFAPNLEYSTTCTNTPHEFLSARMGCNNFIFAGLRAEAASIYKSYAGTICRTISAEAGRTCKEGDFLPQAAFGLTCNGIRKLCGCRDKACARPRQHRRARSPHISFVGLHVPNVCKFNGVNAGVVRVTATPAAGQSFANISYVLADTLGRSKVIAVYKTVAAPSNSNFQKALERTLASLCAESPRRGHAPTTFDTFIGRIDRAGRAAVSEPSDRDKWELARRSTGGIILD